MTDLKRIRARHADPLKALRQALLYLIEFGFNNPHQYKVFFFTSADVYGNKEEFMEKESMARNSYFIFREIVQSCIEADRLQAMDIDVMAQSFAVGVMV